MGTLAFTETNHCAQGTTENMGLEALTWALLLPFLGLTVAAYLTRVFRLSASRSFRPVTKKGKRSRKWRWTSLCRTRQRSQSTRCIFIWQFDVKVDGCVLSYYAKQALEIQCLLGISH